MIRSLEENFRTSTEGGDENSKAYRTMLTGEIPQTSLNTHTHIASRLLTLRFLDIFQALEQNVEIDGEHVSPNNASFLKSNVCFMSLLIQHFDSSC
jgi:hypothetical protein